MNLLAMIRQLLRREVVENIDTNRNVWLSLTPTKPLSDSSLPLNKSQLGTSLIVFYRDLIFSYKNHRSLK